MARPRRDVVMARCAREALLAAVEIYNKPKVEYREQTVAFLIVNAWEVLIKARIVQQSGGKIQSLYQYKRNSREYKRSHGDILTIGIRNALNQSNIPEEIKSNINGIIKIRNRATHLGVLAPDLKKTILEFSTASVQNFIKIYTDWFNESIDVPYLLPLGFVGNAQTAVATYPVRQKELLKELSDLVTLHNVADSSYSVAMHVQVEINRGLSGGGSIGFTNDPSVPKVSISDDEALKTFPTPYNELVDECRSRYLDFKQTKRFHLAMKDVHQDAKCTYERKLDPTTEKSSKKRFYNLGRTLAKLDNEYTKPK